MMSAVEAVNNEQKRTLLSKIERHFPGDLKGKTFAIWGLAFKPRTDDIREAPALVLVNDLLERGAKLQVYDPEAMKNVKAVYGDQLSYAANPLEALHGVDALAICTEWGDFRNPEFDEMKRRMKAPLIFDGRNLYEPENMRAYGFTYYSIGRSPVIIDR
jgi:UDPglucose 6-dehydrogenase